jgi:hypothetical protein
MVWRWEIKTKQPEKGCDQPFGLAQRIATLLGWSAGPSAEGHPIPLRDLSKLEKGASYPGLEIIAKLATVLEVEPAELLKVPPGMPEHLRCRWRQS